jgi:putative ABC transport system permease protein
VGIGVGAGLVGAVVFGALAVARRTATAYDRLVTATALDDARAYVFSDDPTLPSRVAGLSGIERAWIGTMAVARVQGPDVQYVSVLMGPPRPADLFSPLVVAGRAADPANPAEVVAAEGWAQAINVSPRDSFRLNFLTAQEFDDFDVGFGEPDGPTVEIKVVGVVRIPAPDKAPLYATPAFAAGPAGSPDLQAATVVRMRLRDGQDGLSALRRDVAALTAGSAPTPGTEFLPVELDVPGEAAAAVRAATHVLVSGLVVLAAVVALAGGLAIAQALARHHEAGSSDQQIEDALGLTRGERAGARTMAAVPAACLGAGITALGVLAAGWVEPPGAVRAYEPDPGFAPNLAGVAAGGAALGLIFAALAALTAWRTGRRGAEADGGVGAVASAAAAAGGVMVRPTLAAGLALALPHARGEGPDVPVRSTIAGAVVGVAGLVAAATFAASLDRLVTTPARWGWQGDGAILDAHQDVVDRLLSDHRLAKITLLDRAPFRVAGVAYEGQATSALRGDLGWTILSGRAPRTANEIVIGPRLHRRLGLDIGDKVKAERGELRVVGVGIGPSLPNETLGGSVLFTPDGLAAVAQAGSLREALVGVSADADPGVVLEELATDYELIRRAPPAEVANLDQLGPMPGLLGVFLAAVGVTALVHALATTVRRRRRELGVLRVLGFTPAQVARAVTVLALTTAGAGILAGVPLGIGIGRLVWWSVADAAYVASDPNIPWPVLVAVAGGSPVAAVAAALVPARAAARLRPAVVLHGE